MTEEAPTPEPAVTATESKATSVPAPEALVDEAAEEVVEPLGMDPTDTTMAGVAMASYLVRKKANQGGDRAPGRLKRALNRFIESHPTAQSLVEDANIVRENFIAEHPHLVGAWTSFRDASANGSVYSFREQAERNMQAGRMFYEARPRHPVMIWLFARNYDGSVNKERKDELYKQREMGIKRQEAIGPRSIKEALRPSRLFRPELDALDPAVAKSLGARAVAFANIQRIANDKHIALTNRQWAISVERGRILTEAEAAERNRFYADPTGWIRSNIIHPETITT